MIGWILGLGCAEPYAVERDVLRAEMDAAWTYLNDSTWQLAEVQWGSTVETWEWRCLTARITRTDRDEVELRSFHPDGRVRWSVRDTDLDGVPDRAPAWLYVDDTWRIQEVGDLTAPYSAGFYEYVWSEF